MANLQTHIAQAKHNESLANCLLNEKYRDWSVTVSFYAAIHYFEARLFVEHTIEEQRHSSTSIPRDTYRHMYGPKYTHHTWRIELIRKRSLKAWKEYKKLRNASEVARYLTDPDNQETDILPDQPAYLYFGEAQIKNLVESLKTIKTGIKFEIVEFISELGIYSNLKGKDFECLTELMLRFSGKADFLHNGRKFLQERLSEKQMDAFEGCMHSKGYSFMS